MRQSLLDRVTRTSKDRDLSGTRYSLKQINMRRDVSFTRRHVTSGRRIDNLGKFSEARITSLVRERFGRVRHGQIQVAMPPPLLGGHSNREPILGNREHCRHERHSVCDQCTEHNGRRGHSPPRMSRFATH
jgi:hypothetical protein